MQLCTTWSSIALSTRSPVSSPRAVQPSSCTRDRRGQELHPEKSRHIQLAAIWRGGSGLALPGPHIWTPSASNGGVQHNKLSLSLQTSFSVNFFPPQLTAEEDVTLGILIPASQNLMGRGEGGELSPTLATNQELIPIARMGGQERGLAPRMDTHPSRFHLDKTVPSLRGVQATLGDAHGGMTPKFGYIQIIPSCNISINAQFIAESNKTNPVEISLF